MLAARRLLLRGSSSASHIREHIPPASCNFPENFVQRISGRIPVSFQSITDPSISAHNIQYRLAGIDPTSSHGASGPASCNANYQACKKQIRSDSVEVGGYGRMRGFCKPYSTSASADPPSPDVASENSSKERYSGWSRRIGAGLKEILSDLQAVPPSAMGLGLAGAIPFVLLTPPLAYLLPLPDLLKSSPIEAQAAYGAVILSFLGGPYWGLAMAGYARGPVNPSVYSGYTLYTLRYVWSVVPSLLAWPALLLPLVTKLSVLVVSFGFVLGVDAVFGRMGLVPSWYLPLRMLLSLIAMLSMGSSFLVTVARKIPEAVVHSDVKKIEKKLSA
ncbi:hypothetical protein O6H91_09G004800 [Diphasiastrum complanatum]|nr:hypothetical protein O6H91_09G004800 [Diphasiastrum complanatum]